VNRTLFLCLLVQNLLFSLDTLQVLNEDSLSFLPKIPLRSLIFEESFNSKYLILPQSKGDWQVDGKSYIQFVGGDESRFEQNIDLEIKGKLDSNIFIYGELRDSDLPSPGDGGEASLKDIDKAYLSLQGNRGGVELGDQKFNRGKGSWLAQESFLGISGNWNLDSSLFIRSGLGVQRIQKKAVLLYGEEGVQGAYSLLQKAGYQVSKGSVELRLNGFLLEENQDYEIEEATGNLYFLSTIFIRLGDVIDVRFSVLEEEALPLYSRYADIGFKFQKQSLSMQIWDEGLRLDGSEAKLISVDGESYYFTPYLSDSVQYQKFEVQSSYDLINGIYVYLEAPTEGDYVYFPEFVFVGKGMGEYMKDGSNLIFVGEGKGDFLAGILQEGSTDLQLLSFNYQGTKSKVHWDVDFSVSPQQKESLISEGFLGIDLTQFLYIEEEWLIRYKGFNLDLVSYDNWFLWRDLKIRELPNGELGVYKSKLGIKSGLVSDLWLGNTTLNSDSTGVTRNEVGMALELPVSFELEQILANVIDYKYFDYEYLDYFFKIGLVKGDFQPRLWAGYIEYYRSVEKQKGLKELKSGVGSSLIASEVVEADVDFEYDWAEDSLSRKTIFSKFSLIGSKYSFKLSSSMSWLDDYILGDQGQNYLLSLGTSYHVLPRLGLFRLNFDYGYFKDQKLIKKFIRVEEGTGDVVFDKKDSSYVENVLFGDYMLEGFVRDSLNSASYSNKIDWSLSHQVALGKAMNVNSGFLSHLSMRNKVLWKSVDTSSVIYWFPQFEKEWNEGLFDLNNGLIWNKEKHSINLNRNLLYSKIFGLKKSRSLVWSSHQNSMFNKILLGTNISDGYYRWGEGQNWKETSVGLKPGYNLPYNIKAYLLFGLRELQGSSFNNPFEVYNYELGNEWDWLYKGQLLNASYRFMRTSGEWAKLPLRVKGDLLDGNYHNLQVNTQMQISEGIGLDAIMNVYLQKDQDIKAQVRINLGGSF
jgi:hypothetical protein